MKHGHKTKNYCSKTWRAWQAMKQRCLNSNNKNFSYYGGREIRINKRWLGEDGFINFLADLGECPIGLTLERIDVNGNYNQRNCIWADRGVQARNRRSSIKYNGETATEASKRLGGGSNLVKGRIRYGMSIQRAFTLPKKDGNYRNRK